MNLYSDVTRYLYWNGYAAHFRMARCLTGIESKIAKRFLVVWHAIFTIIIAASPVFLSLAISFIGRLTMILSHFSRMVRKFE